MSYTALYRKLRPRIFEDVIGQNHIIKTLKNQIQTNRVSHAYLFCGTRGTGKTSTAKIFAKAINCMDNKNGEPCGECTTCKNIGRNINLIEIDAASNNGVDNIRDIREEVKYMPTEGKFKVYIIDEVHMLSTGAFNALLKTLEEPPAHVIFILATTEVQKIPATILSRCQRFDFKRISINDMVTQIKKYMADENIEADENALRYIARVSDGAMRDALSILDQCIAFYFGEKITLEKVQEVLGSVDNNVFFELTEAIMNFDSRSCIKIIDDIILNGRDISQFNTEFIAHLRNLLVVKSLSDVKALDMSIENYESMKVLADKIQPNNLIHYINILSAAQSQMRFASNPRIVFEIASIKLCNPEVEQNLPPEEAILQRIRKIENKIQSGNFTQKTAEKIEEVKENIPVVKEKAVPEDIKNMISDYQKFLDSIVSDNILLREQLKLCETNYIDGDVLYIVYDIDNDGYFEKEKKNLKPLLEEYFNREINLKLIRRDKFDEMHKRAFGYTEEKNDALSEIKNKLNLN